MAVGRIVPNLSATDPDVGHAFFTEALGLTVAMQLSGFITTYRAPGTDVVQLSVLAHDPSGDRPDYSVGCDDVDAMHERVVALGLEVVYPLTDEPWGVRRFFVRDPTGRLANIVEHRS